MNRPNDNDALLKTLHQLLTLYNHQLRDSRKKIGRPLKQELVQCAREFQSKGYIDVEDFLNVILKNEFFDDFFKVKQMDKTYMNCLHLQSEYFSPPNKNPSKFDYIQQVTTHIQKHFEDVNDVPSDYLIVYPCFTFPVTKEEIKKQLVVMRTDRNKHMPTRKIRLDLKEMSEFRRSFKVKIGDKIYLPEMIIYMPFNKEKRDAQEHFVSMIYDDAHAEDTIIEDDLEEDNWIKVSSIEKGHMYGVPRVILFRNSYTIIPSERIGVAHLTNDGAKCFLNSALQLFSRIPMIHHMLSSKFQPSSVTARSLDFTSDVNAPAPAPGPLAIRVPSSASPGPDKKTKKKKELDPQPTKKKRVIKMEENLEKIQETVLAILRDKIPKIINRQTLKQYGFDKTVKVTDIKAIAQNLIEALT